MTANHDLERRVADFYATEAPRRAPDRVLEQALATIDHTRQRRELRLVPRRFPTMNIYAKLAVAAVVVLAVAALGLNLAPRGAGPSVGGIPPASTPPPASPTTLPSAPTSASPSPMLTPAPLTGTYTSAIHGLSIQHPAEWTVVPATDPEGAIAHEFLSPAGDFLHDPELRDHLFIAIGSEPLDGETGEAWATAHLDDPANDCTIEPEPITVDGTPGLLCGQLALTWGDDRGYSIRLYTSGDEPEVNDAYDRAWFDQVLASVQLPADGAQASPSG